MRGVTDTKNVVHFEALGVGEQTVRCNVRSESVEWEVASRVEIVSEDDGAPYAQIVSIDGPVWFSGENTRSLRAFWTVKINLENVSDQPIDSIQVDCALDGGPLALEARDPGPFYERWYRPWAASIAPRSTFSTGARFYAATVAPGEHAIVCRVTEQAPRRARASELRTVLRFEPGPGRVN